MRDSSGSSTTAPPHFMPAVAAGGRKDLPRTLVLAGATVAAVIICSIHGVVASADTARGAGIGYLCDSLILFGCGAALWTRERSSQGALRMRWFLFAAAALLFDTSPRMAYKNQNQTRLEVAKDVAGHHG